MKLVLSVVPVAFFSTSIAYGLLYLSPANAAAEIVGPYGTEREVHNLAVLLGTNRPFLAQYWSWLSAALQGNLGKSYFTHLPVSTSIAQRLPVDLSIAAMALLIGVTLGPAGGIVAALNRGKLVDRTITWFCAVAYTVPEFWLGMLFIVLFSVVLRLLPASGYVGPSTNFVAWFQHAIMPATSLAIVPASGIARQLRTSLVEVLGENFVVGAVVRGLSPRRVLFRHALRNAAGPAVSAIGLYVPGLIGGAIIAELVFGLPGIGQFALQGAEEKDMPVIQGVLVVLIAIVLASNLVVNMVLGWLRPASRS
jgi:peptide/nickel transport system permease protein